MSIILLKGLSTKHYPHTRVPAASPEAKTPQHRIRKPSKKLLASQQASASAPTQQVRLLCSTRVGLSHLSPQPLHLSPAKRSGSTGIQRLRYSHFIAASWFNLELITSLTTSTAPETRRSRPCPRVHNRHRSLRQRNRCVSLPIATPHRALN
jgi:hypothetical protein